MATVSGQALGLLQGGRVEPRLQGHAFLGPFEHGTRRDPPEVRIEKKGIYKGT